MLITQIMHSHKIDGYKCQTYSQKSTQSVKCSLCVDYAIINKELMTTDFTFSWLSLPQQWWYTNTQLQQLK